MKQNRKVVSQVKLLSAQKRPWFPLLFIAILLSPCLSIGQISGSVSYNTNSEQASFSQNANSIRIKAYGISEAGKYEIIAQTWSDKSGSYFLDIPEGKHVKLVFEDESKRLQSSGSTPAVRFVKRAQKGGRQGGRIR